MAKALVYATIYLEVYFLREDTKHESILYANMHIVTCMFYLQAMASVIFYFSNFSPCFVCIYLHLFFIVCNFVYLFYLFLPKLHKVFHSDIKFFCSAIVLV